MKLSQLLLFPEKRIKSDDGLILTTFGNDPVDDPQTLEFLNMLVSASTVEEVRYCLMMGFDQWSRGNLVLDVGMFGDVLPLN